MSANRYSSVSGLTAARKVCGGGGMDTSRLWMCGHKGVSTGAEIRNGVAMRCAACVAKAPPIRQRRRSARPRHEPEQIFGAILAAIKEAGLVGATYQEIEEATGYSHATAYRYTARGESQGVFASGTERSAYQRGETTRVRWWTADNAPTERTKFVRPEPKSIEYKSIKRPTAVVSQPTPDLAALLRPRVISAFDPDYQPMFDRV